MTYQLPLILLGLLLLGACTTHQAPHRLDMTEVQEGIPKGAALRAHLFSGELLILHEYSIDAEHHIEGMGRRISPDRAKDRSGFHRVSIDSVTMFEADRRTLSPGSVPIIAAATITTVVAIACLTNPKACFGSCPTFYAREDGEWQLRAEGFSASIAPSLEATDRDALRSRGTGEDFTLRMTNDAQETHMIRRVELFGVPRGDHDQILQDQEGLLFGCGPAQAPHSASWGPEDLLLSIAEDDGQEWSSPTDSLDLGRDLEVDLHFVPIGEGPWAIQIEARQSLLTTYLFYQAMAWMGTQWASALSALERGVPQVKAGAGALGRALGGIELLYQREGSDEWEVAGSVGETGPLATDTKLIALPERVQRGPNGDLTLRLRMNQGLWRIDQIALCALGEQLEAEILPLIRVEKEGQTDAVALQQLLDDDFLITLPGDAYDLQYELPEWARAGKADLFLDATGYYLEWMREEWLKEENTTRALQAFMAPELMLRELAPAYKELEVGMDEIFWGSRYAEFK